MKHRVKAGTSVSVALLAAALAACSGETESDAGGTGTGTASSATGAGGSSTSSSGTSTSANASSTSSASSGGAASGSTSTGAGGATGSNGATGSGTTGSGGAATGSGGAATTGSGGGPGDDYVDCPPTLPADGSECEMAGTLFCTYGDDPRWNCRTQAFCSASVWSVQETPETCDPDPLPAECPEAPLPNEACSEAQLQCVYPDGTQCVCTDCPVSSPVCGATGDFNWYCFERPEDCPLYPPNLGTRCGSPGQECVYDCATNFICGENDAWTQGGFSCPICNSPDTPIATPAGERSVAELRPGDLVYSIDRGELAIVPIERIGSTGLRNHRVVRAELENGSVLEISPGHPTADGRTFADLVPGGRLDGVRVVAVSRIPYRHDRTYDILPRSDTGTYFAGGVLIGSTLAGAPSFGAGEGARCAGALPASVEDVTRYSREP
ncbi:MAG TPA: Hint domain-containing protein [Polyangiaceae bacterium]